MSWRSETFAWAGQKERRRWKPKKSRHKDADIIKMWKETRNFAMECGRLSVGMKIRVFSDQSFGVTSRKRGWTCKIGRLYVCEHSYRFSSAKTSQRQITDQQKCRLGSFPALLSFPPDFRDMALLLPHTHTTPHWFWCITLEIIGGHHHPGTFTQTKRRRRRIRGAAKSVGLRKLLREYVG
jgi:hypothetical protein